MTGKDWAQNTEKALVSRSRGLFIERLQDNAIKPSHTRGACNINISKPPWFLLLFYPSGAIDTLSIADEKYFKPSREDFRPPSPPSEDDTAKTKHGWHFKSGSYLLLPFREAFGKQFPSQYTVMLTIRPSKDLGDVSENELIHISQLGHNVTSN